MTNDLSFRERYATTLFLVALAVLAASLVGGVACQFGVAVGAALGGQ